MRNFIIAAALVFSLTVFGQTKPTTTTKTQPSQKVVKKQLYTKEEKEKAKKNFKKDIEQIGMSPEVKAKYTAIVQKHRDRIAAANKDRKMTKEQATFYVNKVVDDQNKEIQEILTAEQYKKHLQIMNRYQNSILYRIEKQ